LVGILFFVQDKRTKVEMLQQDCRFSTNPDAEVFFWYLS